MFQNTTIFSCHCVCYFHEPVSVVSLLPSIASSELMGIDSIGMGINQDTRNLGTVEG
jgi:hypothetical protein